MAAFAGDARLSLVTELATRVTQNDDEAVAWALTGAVVLERLIGGAGPAAVVEATIREMEQGDCWVCESFLRPANVLHAISKTKSTSTKLFGGVARVDEDHMDLRG